MPTYDYSCPGCGTVEEQTHSIKDTPEFPCPECGSPMKRLISHNGNGFVFKGGTTTTHQREKDLRKKKSAELSVKQRESKRFVSTVVPNVAGMQVDSWSDAQKVAKEAGMNTETYKPWVDKEQSKQLITKL